MYNNLTNLTFAFAVFLGLAACQSPTQKTKISFNRAQQVALMHLEENFGAIIDSQKANQVAAHIPAEDFQKITALLKDSSDFLLDSSGIASRAELYNDAALLIQVRDMEENRDSIEQYLLRYGAVIVDDMQEDNPYFKKQVIYFESSPQNLLALVKDIKNDAFTIRRKDSWKQHPNTTAEHIQFSILNQQANMESIPALLEQENNGAVKQALHERNNALQKDINLLALKAERLATKKPKSRVALTCFEIKANDAQKAQSADFSNSIQSNMIAGWTNFKMFLLDMAFLWPFVIIGLLLLSTVLLAVRSSKKKARAFRLKTLELQRQMVQGSNNNI